LYSSLTGLKTSINLHAVIAFPLWVKFGAMITKSPGKYILVLPLRVNSFGTFFHLPKSKAHFFSMDKLAMVTGHNFLGRDFSYFNVHVYWICLYEYKKNRFVKVEDPKGFQNLWDLDHVPICKSCFTPISQ